jgi:signal transduction histidine kinase
MIGLKTNIVVRLLAFIGHAWLCGCLVAAQSAPKRNVLIPSEVGVSHSLMSLTTPEIIDTSFLADYAQSSFPGIPIVICGSSADQAGNPKLSSPFTGTRQIREPIKTLDLALHLFPKTENVFIVGGSSAYDQSIESNTEIALNSRSSEVRFTDLFDLKMDNLLRQLQTLPPDTFFTSFFQDAAGNRFLNASKALPMVVAAASVPASGMSDTYVGQGIVGGAVMSFEEQGKVTAKIVSQLLDGKKPGEFPIQTLPSVYMFGWKQLRPWHIPDQMLPLGSVVRFGEPSLWGRARAFILLACFTIPILASLVIYLFFSRRQLDVARREQQQLSGLLINATENERRRIASELHDDFSQRVAMLAFQLDEVAEKVAPVSPDADREIRKLLATTSELGADLHTLSHRLHSSTLENLGLEPAIRALCKEFGAREGFNVDLKCDGLLRSIPPDVALCVFRVTQEALRNSRKYSGASQAGVELRHGGSGLWLTVSDHGCGFDPAILSQREGLGIRIMEARIRSLGGKLEVNSTPDHGTTVVAWIPCSPQYA